MYTKYFAPLCVAMATVVAFASNPVVRVTTEYQDGTKQVFVPESPSPVPVPVAKSNVGINLSPVRYYTPERPFTDLAKTMSTWQWTLTTGGWANASPGPVDANGYPTSIPAGTYAGFLVDLKPGHPLGSYVASPTTGLQPAAFNKTQPSQRLLMKATQPLSSLSIKQAGDSNELFYPPFLARTKAFGTLRMMDWLQTNADRPIAWETRIKPSWYTQAEREVAWEYLIELAKQCDSNLWINIHHRADDTYVRELAKLFKAQWPGTRKLYLEYSNEVWNGGFPAYRYCYDRSPVTRSPLEYSMRRTAEIARIFRAEGVDVISTLGAQSVAYAHFEWVLRQVPIPKDINCVAIAPYFGYSVASKTGTVDQILAELDSAVTANSVEIKAWSAIAARLGLELAAYEAGQHLAASVADQANQLIVDNYIAVNRHPRMYDLYRRYLKQWDELTGKSLICLFNSCYEPSKHGSWGLLEYEGQDPAAAHKYRAVMDHMQGK